MLEPQTWRESFAVRRLPWLAEYTYRSLLRLPIRFVRKGLAAWWWLDRLYPTTSRAFPARVGRVTLSVTLEDAVGRAIFYGRGPLRYEAETSSVLLSELAVGDTFLDGGASYGWYTALAVSRVGQSGFTYPVEANRALARVLETDLTRARVDNALVIGAALGAAPGSATLGRPFSDADDYQKTIGTQLEGDLGGSAEVDVVTIDSLNLPRLDVVKLDIEGAEMDGLLGASETLRRCRPRLLLVEAIDENLARCGRSLEELAALLDAAGYTHAPVAKSAYEAPMWACRPKHVA